MSTQEILQPSQIRAARALLDISQAELAEQAKVSISTLRDLESSKRPLDTEKGTAIRQVLEARGVEFVGLGREARGGAGVRFVEPKPRISFGPVLAAGGLGLVFSVDRDGGNPLPCLVSREAIEDLGQLSGRESVDLLLTVFKKFEAKIVDCAIELSFFENTKDHEGRVLIRSRDLARPRHIPEVFRELLKVHVVELSPAPIRILKGSRQEGRFNLWSVHSSEPTEGKCVLQNLASDHLLVLYAAHADSVTTAQPNSGVDAILNLRVQPVIQDGHYRLEHPRAMT